MAIPRPTTMGRVTTTTPLLRDWLLTSRMTQALLFTHRLLAMQLTLPPEPQVRARTPGAFLVLRRPTIPVILVAHRFTALLVDQHWAEGRRHMQEPRSMIQAPLQPLSQDSRHLRSDTIREPITRLLLLPP